MKEKTQKKLKRLGLLFVHILMTSALTFGGGYVIVGVLKKKFVDKLHLLEEGEMLDIISIAQSAPGVMAVNSAILVGYRIAGFWGALVGAVATAIPPLVVMSIVAYVYTIIANNEFVRLIMTGMRAGIAAVILSIGLDMAKTSIKKSRHRIIGMLLLLASLVAVVGFSINVAYVIVAAIAVGIIIALVELSQDNKKRKIRWLTADDIIFEEDVK